MITTQEIMERIKLPREAQIQVNKQLLTEEEYNQKRKLFVENGKEFFVQWKEKENRYQWILTFYIQLACEVYEEYKKNGISDKIFNDAFYDITIWTEECHRKYNIWGLEEAEWLELTLKRKLFRLGRLQFEPIILEKEIRTKSKILEVGTQVLNVHIPSGEKMDYEKCLESLKQAENFFGRIYEGYVCDSWLLSPKLLDFIPENSNIARFQRMFEIVEVHYKFPQAEQRIFNDIREDKENYPENTILQKKAKEYICAGNDIGIGIGFLALEKIKDNGKE